MYFPLLPFVPNFREYYHVCRFFCRTVKNRKGVDILTAGFFYCTIIKMFIHTWLNLGVSLTTHGIDNECANEKDLRLVIDCTFLCFMHTSNVCGCISRN